MLARPYHLKRKDDIPGLLKRGKLGMNRLLVARFRRNEVEKHHRFSVLVSTNIATQAVDRNRVRRRIYSLLRKHYDRVPSLPIFDVVILPKKSILTASFKDIEAALLSLIPSLRGKTTAFSSGSLPSF
ncbi:MAG: ribonuclease P protein component [Candidatus Gracilibacteria bacterium]